MPRSIDEHLAETRFRLARLDPAGAAAAVARGALLVDIRPVGLRGVHGTIPGALIVDRNQLEWRLDPASDARLPEAVDHDAEIVLFCQAGYASSLGAASLQALGLHRATDLIGGFDAWAEAGLPVEPPPRPVSEPSA